MFRRFAHALLVLGIRAGLIVLSVAVYLCYWQFRKGGLLDVPMPVMAQYEPIRRPCGDTYRAWTRLNDRDADSIYQSFDDDCYGNVAYGHGWYTQEGSGRVIHVSTTGRGTTCTASAPCSMHTLSVGTMMPGNTIVFASGVYDMAERR